MNLSDLELLVLNHVNSSSYRPAKPRVITKRLGLPESRKPDVRKAVKRLAKGGLIAYGANHVVEAAAPTAAERTNSRRVTEDRGMAGSLWVLQPL